MKKIIFLILFLFCLFCFSAYADELQQPLTCYPKKVQEVFSKYDLKIDLYPEDRISDSWGFLRSYGNNFSIFTYKKLTKEELKLTIKIMREYIQEVEVGKNNGQ